TKGISGGAWGLNSNWTSNAPTVTSDACITSGYTINLHLATGTTKGLDITSGTLSLQSGVLPPLQNPTLAVGSDGLTLRSGTISGDGLIGGTGGLTAVSGASQIIASANILELANSITLGGGTLAITINGGSGNGLRLDASSAATSLTFSGAGGLGL